MSVAKGNPIICQGRRGVTGHLFGPQRFSKPALWQRHLSSLCHYLTFAAFKGLLTIFLWSWTTLLASGCLYPGIEPRLPVCKSYILTTALHCVLIDECKYDRNYKRTTSWSFVFQFQGRLSSWRSLCCRVLRSKLAGSLPLIHAVFYAHTMSTWVSVDFAHH